MNKSIFAAVVLAAVCALTACETGYDCVYYIENTTQDTISFAKWTTDTYVGWGDDSQEYKGEIHNVAIFPGGKYAQHTIHMERKKITETSLPSDYSAGITVNGVTYPYDWNREDSPAYLSNYELALPSKVDGNQTEYYYYITEEFVDKLKKQQSEE